MDFAPRWILALLLPLLAMPGGASAQDQPSAANPVIGHFRAYQTALAAGDLATAEREADAALAASVTRNGDGGSTGVLAINLAQTRLSMGRREEAYAPALQAFNIASSGSANLDPLLAQLVLGRAELTDDRWRAGRERLRPALDQAKIRADLNAETYNASADLGRRLLSEGAYSSAIAVWDIALAAADATPGDNAYARAEARIWRAASVISLAGSSVAQSQSRPTDTRLNINADEAFDEADRQLVEAQSIVGPHAFARAEGDGVTHAQRTYANALAWRRMLGAFAESRGLRNLSHRRPSFELRRDDARPECLLEFITEPSPHFPPGAQTAFAAGAVVVRYSIDDSGRVADTRVVAAIPEQWFREAVERVAPQWTVRLAPDSPPGCRYEPIAYQTCSFLFR